MGNLTAIRFAQEEASQAAASPADAARSAYSRADALILDAPGRAGWACRAGCAACCHLLVRVHAGEADAIAGALRTSWSDAARNELYGRLAHVASEAKDLDAGTYRAHRIPCAFLDENERCSIYDTRPVVCRVHASRSATACEDLERLPPLDTWLSKIGKAIHAGMGDSDLEELHGAVLRRLDPS